MSGNVWEVVGGKDSGGITVRTGKDLKSPEAAGGRLSHGALIAEIQLDGERLRFSRLTGTGPDDGWVSLSFKSRALIARAGEPGTRAAADAAELKAAFEAKERGEQAKPKPGCYRLWLLPQGSRGDIQPMLAVALAARRAGWAVRLMAGEDGRTFVEAYGIDFVRMGPTVLGSEFADYRNEEKTEEMLKKHKENEANQMDDTVSEIFSQEVQMETARALLEEIEKAKEADALPDALFFHPLAGTGPFLIWDTYGVPIFHIDYVSASISSDEDHGMFMHHLAETHGPELKSRFGKNPFEGWDVGAMSQWKKDRTISCSSRLQLLTYDIVMAQPEPVVSYLMSRFTGPCIMEPSSQMMDLQSFGGQEVLRRAQDFLDAGPPPAYAGWGSMMVTPALVAKVITNAKFVKLRVIVLGGWQGTNMEDLVGFVKKFMPEDPFGLIEYARTNVLFLAVAPHEWLFQRCCFTVHHGGAGTTQAALRSGKPTIITPYGSDQFQWAEFVTKLGCGQTLSLMGGDDKIMHPEWTKAFRKASSDATMIARAKEIGEMIRQERGTAEVLDRIKDGIERKARGEDAGKFCC